MVFSKGELLEFQVEHIIYRGKYVDTPIVDDGKIVVIEVTYNSFGISNIGKQKRFPTKYFVKKL